MIYQDIFQALWAETKKNNLSINSVKGAFAEYDLDKHGFTLEESFEAALESKLKIHTLK